MQGTEEKPKSSLLQNMEMGNAAFWEDKGDSAGAAAPNGVANGEQPQEPPASRPEGQQPAAAAQPPAPRQSELTDASACLNYFVCRSRKSGCARLSPTTSPVKRPAAVMACWTGQPYPTCCVMALQMALRTRHQRQT